MFPNEVEVQYRRQELERTAENFRFAREARSVPTFWERLRTRLSTRPNEHLVEFAPCPEATVTHPHVIATSR